VYDFLQDEVPVGIVGQIGESDYSFEISSMSVDITGYNQAAFGRQMNQITASKSICAAGLPSLV
jgi:hypothetical protein